jgi:hypothetical protein
MGMSGQESGSDSPAARRSLPPQVPRRIESFQCFPRFSVCSSFDGHLAGRVEARDLFAMMDPVAGWKAT